MKQAWMGACVVAIHRFGVLSDTHGYTHPDLYSLLQGVELILHAGDVGEERVLDDLETIAPVLAVRGNVDLPSKRMPGLRVEPLAFGTVVLTHSHLLPDGERSPKGLARHFASHRPRLIVFGHSHLQYLDRHEGIWLLNPGPGGRPRFNDRPSVVLMTWDEDTDALRFELKELSRPERTSG